MMNDFAKWQKLNPFSPPKETRQRKGSSNKENTATDLIKIIFILFNHNFPIIIDNTLQTDATFLWNLQYASFTTIFYFLKIQRFSFQNIKKIFFSQYRFRNARSR